MRVLLVGSGGREHALAVTLGRSPMLDALFIAPGNPGTAALGTNVANGLRNSFGDVKKALAELAQLCADLLKLNYDISRFSSSEDFINASREAKKKKLESRINSNSAPAAGN